VQRKSLVNSPGGELANRSFLMRKTFWLSGRLFAMLIAGAGIAAAVSSSAAEAEAKIHPFTQQTHDQWLAKLTEAEAASKPGGTPEAARPVLEACDVWFMEKKKTLEKHPEFKTPYVRQLTLRIKLARIVSIFGLAAAEGAVKQKKTDLLDAKGGAYEQLDKADKIAATIVEALGNDQKPVQDLLAYLKQVREKVKEKAASIKGSGGAEGISLAVPAGTKLHSFTKQTFEKWVGNITEDSAILASDKKTEEKIRELEGGQRWYRSNLQELAKHPNYSQALPKMSELMLGLAVCKAQRAIEFAEKGLADMNPNMFSEHSGTFQQLKEAEKLVEDFGKNTDAAKATEAIASAKISVQALSDKYSEKSASSFKLPKDAYAGADKDALGKQVLAKWKAENPNDEILAVRFIKADWERKKESTFNNGTWYHYDNSVLLTYVVIKKNADLATVYPAYINKNNQTDAIAIGAQTKGNGYSHQDMLIKNIDQ
jgi:hypothetical protein